MTTQNDEKFANEWYEKIVVTKSCTLSDLIEGLS